MPPEQKALFLERDGVINEDLGHVHLIKYFHFLPGVLAACRKFHEAGYKLVVVSNQAGIAKGYYSLDEFEEPSTWMSARLSGAGAPLSGIYFCPHHPDGSVRDLRKVCDCRKPAPGLLLRAQRELALDMKRSILVGDRDSDILAAQAAGIGVTYLVGQVANSTGASHSDQAHYSVTSLSEIAASLSQRVK